MLPVDVEHTRETVIQLGRNLRLTGDLIVPDAACGIVVFAHGSGSSRQSPRNKAVAQYLRKGGFGTLLFDLLTVEEELGELKTGHLRFDIELLAERVGLTTEWLLQRGEVRGMHVGYFGASTGAAAALVAAAQRPDVVKAVVSRGGRPDLADDWLTRLQTPTLLLVGSEDGEVLQLNRRALDAMPARTIKALTTVPGASHLFEEPGALEEVSRLARSWFSSHLALERQWV